MDADDPFDKEVLRSLDKMILPEAIAASVTILRASRTAGPKKAALIADVSRARTSVEVCRIMWQAQLSGDGLSLVGSTWQARFGGAR